MDDAALTAFRADRKFVSLLAQVANEPAHRQQFADQQWAELSGGGRAGDVPAAIVAAWPGTWTTEAVRFGAHCVHWGFGWGQVQAHGPGLVARSRPRRSGIPATGSTTNVISASGRSTHW